MKPHALHRFAVLLLAAFVVNHFFVDETKCVLGQAPTKLTWSADGTKALIASRSKSDAPTFFLIDVENKTRNLAFDHAKVATLISKELGISVEDASRKIQKVRFSTTSGNLIFLVDFQSYELNLEDETFFKSKKQIGQAGKLFWPPRRSSNGDSTNLMIANQLKCSIEIFWIGPEGPQSYGMIPPGEDYRTQSYVGHSWLIKTSKGDPLGCYVVTPNDRVVVSKEEVDQIKAKVADNPDGLRGVNRERAATQRNERKKRNWQVFVRDQELWLRTNLPAPGRGIKRNVVEKRLASGEPRNTFLRNPSNTNSGASVYWAPDEQHLLAIQRQPIETRKVHFVESSPKNQMQPVLQSYPYPKPGDELEKRKLRLFSLKDPDNPKEIALSDELFKRPYRLRILRWSESGETFYLHYNERGHQVIRLLEVSVEDGSVRTIAENVSQTFLEHTVGSKNVVEFIGEEQLIWSSQRSGWNHLYLYDLASGKPINPITSGNWNVKRIEDIDTDLRQVWFYAVGVYPDQDPYHEHFCRVDFDGNNFKILTEGDGTHKIEFERNGKYFVDTWSRVDQAPVSELRSSDSGDLISELDRIDTSAEFGSRKLTTRFNAPGRDGTTPIYGIIHFPIDFDPEKKYPVVENIYAGPHDQHVPKAFRKRYRHQHQIADAGMIVVQIDGMGTAWRSKKFHDVCYKNLKDAGFPDRIAWMKAAAKEHPQMDLSRVGIYGGSAGGQNAMAALLWHNDFYRVAVADCGCHDNRMDKMWWNEQWMGFPVDQSYSENSNVDNAHLLKGHLMLTVGEKDRNVDPASTTQVVDALIKADKDFEFVLIPGGGHGVGESKWASKKRLNFLKRHLDVD